MRTYRRLRVVLNNYYCLLWRRSSIPTLGTSLLWRTLEATQRYCRTTTQFISPSPDMHGFPFKFFLLCTAAFAVTYPLLHGRDQCTAAHFWFIFVVFSTLLAVATYLYTLRYTQDQSTIAIVAVDSQELIRDQPLRVPCQETQTGPSKMVSGR